jgi:prepilin-type N-terminal cleavage/methylation domain-containing protein
MNNMRKNGLTLIEILLAVAIVAMMVTVTLVSTGGLRKQAQVKLTESTLAVVMSALQQYNEFWGAYPPQISAAQNVETNDTNARLAIANAIGAPLAASLTSWPGPTNHKGTCTYSEALYLRLYRTPVCRKMIDGITPVSDKSTAKKASLSSLAFTPDTTDTTGKTPTSVTWKPLGSSDSRTVTFYLYRFVDAWRQPLRYQYTAGSTTPTLISNGPDMVADTADDIKSTGR